MSRQYVSNQPQGFKNHIQNVAIVGVGGHVGKFIAEELLKTGKHTVTAITRGDSTSTVPTGLETRKVNYDDQSSLVNALRGQDALIITMAATAPPEQQGKLVDAAATAGVPFVIPNEWGYDLNDSKLGEDTMLGAKILADREHIEKLGKSSWLGIVCGFWYEWSLSLGSNFYGIDTMNKTVTFFGDGETPINSSTWPFCARAVANLLALPILAENENDKSICLNGLRNRQVYIASFTVTQKSMLESVLRVTGTDISDWKINSEPVKERYEAGIKELQQGDRMGFAKMLYTRLFYPDDSGNYGKTRGWLDNKVLGLPESEDLDEATRRAVELAESGFLFR